MKRIIGRAFVNSNKGIIDESGYWHVDVVMTESVYYSDGTDTSEKIEASSIDRNYDDAHKLALTSALLQLRDEVYDKGFTSLVDARDSSRKLFVDDNSKIDTDTPIQ